MPAFRPSDEGLERALAVLARERGRVASLAPGGQLILTGANSVPGVLTSGDVDLHLQVEPAAFAETVERLRTVYDVVLPEIWTDSLATFAVPNEQVGIAVTPVGSEHDGRFTGSWDRLRADPMLREAYNALKRAYDDSDDPRYVAAKAAFFDRVSDARQDPARSRRARR